MKKVFFTLAVVAMFSFAACNGNNAETTEDTANTEATVEDQAPAEDMTIDAVPDCSSAEGEAESSEEAKNE